MAKVGDHREIYRKKIPHKIRGALNTLIRICYFCIALLKIFPLNYHGNSNQINGVFQLKFLFSIKIFRLIFLPSLLIISAIINHYWNTPSSIIIFSTFTAIYTLYLGYIDYMGNLRKDNRLKYLSEAFINLSSFANRPPPILYEQLIKESLKNNKEINPEILSNIDKEGNFKNQAYNLIAKEYNKNLQEAEKAISIIHLYGTPEEIKLACEFVKNFGDNNPNIEPGNLDKILQKLRDELRKELEYERTEEIIKNLRLERSFPRKE